MKRIIKFKAWDKVNKKWIEPKWYGEILVGGDNIARTDYKPHNGGYILDKTYLFNNDEVDNIEVVQFTGLQDKNGKDIYEGDFFKILGGKGRMMQGEVYFSEGSFRMKYGFQTPLSHERKDYFLSCVVDSETALKTEIIGNIYENQSRLFPAE